MITGELKNKVDKIWEIFWTGGLANPLDVIEQLTYLMFVRDLDQIDQTRQRESLMLSIPHKSVFQGKEQLKWSIFIHKSAEDMYKIMQAEVFPFIKQLNGNSGTYAKYMADAIFKVPTPQLLERLVTWAVPHAEAYYPYDGRVNGFTARRHYLRPCLWYKWLFGSGRSVFKRAIFRRYFLQ